MGLLLGLSSGWFMIWISVGYKKVVVLLEFVLVMLMIFWLLSVIGIVWKDSKVFINLRSRWLVYEVDSWYWFEC